MLDNLTSDDNFEPKLDVLWINPKHPLPVTPSLKEIEEKPTLHKSVPMGTRVRIPSYFHKDKDQILTGEVVGISSLHVIFSYIVLLDKPLDTPYGDIKAVVVNGPELVSEDGLMDWKLK